MPFRALSPKAIAELKAEENVFAIETEMIAAAVEKNLKIAKVPIHRDGTKYTGKTETIT